MDIDELNTEWNSVVSQFDKIQLEITKLLKKKDELSREIQYLKISAWNEGYVRDQTFTRWIKNDESKKPDLKEKEIFGIAQKRFLGSAKMTPEELEHALEFNKELQKLTVEERFKKFTV